MHPNTYKSTKKQRDSVYLLEQVPIWKVAVTELLQPRLRSLLEHVPIWKVAVTPIHDTTDPVELEQVPICRRLSPLFKALERFGAVIIDPYILPSTKVLKNLFWLSVIDS